MTKPSAISRLLSGIQRETHDFRPSLQIFQDLNVGRVANDMLLAEKGKERGQRNEPPSSSATFDDVENLIVERVESEKRSAQSNYLNHLHTFSERLTGLDFESRFSAIQQAAPEAIGDFRAEAAQGRSELFTLRRHVREVEDDRFSFKQRHKIKRTARVSSRAKDAVSIGLLMVLFVVEVAVNASFLKEGNRQGFLGGAVQAVSFAVLNVGVSFFLGFLGIRQINHRSPFLKFIGLLAIIGYFIFAAGLNLILSHYREVSALFLPEAGIAVMTRIFVAPFALSDLNSWLFFSIGALFSLIAVADGIAFRDPYPGYEALEKRVKHGHENYVARRAELIADLQDIRDNASEAMTEASRDLSLKRGEFDAILQARSRVDSSFLSHQAHLERAVNSLLSIYREENRRARTTAQPEHFGKSYMLERLPAEPDTNTERARDDLRASIAKTQELLSAHIKEIQAEFESSINRYHQIDEILPEGADGTLNQKS